MYDFKKQLVSALNEILPTYYELFVDSTTTTPCITYIENNNASYLEGDNIRYSHISYIIKLWGSTLNDLTPYALQIDEVMRNLGFRRISANELIMDMQIEKIFTYQALAYEKY